MTKNQLIPLMNSVKIISAIVFFVVVLSAVVIAATAYLVPPAQASFNPFEGLFGKSEEQRKQEIYKVVKDDLDKRVEDCGSVAFCPAKIMDVVELTNRIYEEERLEGTEYSEIEITFKISDEIIKQF